MALLLTLANMLPEIKIMFDTCNISAKSVLRSGVMSKSLDTLIRRLRADGSLKAWSLIITFFGDSIVPRGGNVSASTVQIVLAEMGIGAGAVRTAFSRLASDGWVERQKNGRRSYYQLTEQGIKPFAQASRTIYSPVQSLPADASQWSLCLAQDASKLQSLTVADSVTLPNRSVLLLNPSEESIAKLRKRGMLCVVGQCDDIPEWVIEHLCPEDWRQQIKTLRSMFNAVALKPPKDPLAALVVRTLLVHQWRRLLLRYPPLPAKLKGEALDIENQCREFIGQLYHQLSTQAENWLSEHGAAINGALPEADQHPLHRFTQRYVEN